jgi:molybdenum cofactor guanylyltransferase
MEVTKLNGLVLSGGRSSRMGVDKGTLEYHGKPQLHYLVDLLSAFCDHVLVSARKEQIANDKFDRLPDRFAIGGPMNGILSALSTHPDHTWLIVAVDMPNVTTDVLELLIRHRDPTRLATCFLNAAENLPEPLLTIWEPAALPWLMEFVNAGEISPRKFLQENHVKLVNANDPAILLNINSPEEFLKFKSNLSKG